MKYSIVLSTLLAAAAAAAEQPPVARVDSEDASNRFAAGGAVAGDSSADSTADKTGEIEHPDFEAYPNPAEFKQAVLFEQFVGDSKELFSKWKTSTAKKDDDFSYVGRWAIEEPTVVPGFRGDKGLVLKSPAAHHAISRKFDKPLDNKGKSLVLQYEVKTQNGLQCGGAYVKLLSASADLDNSEFSNETPYQVMFGPDRCGSTDKVHLIIKRKDPKTGEYEEKHLARPARTRPGLLSTLYTLILNPDQTYEVRINGQSARSGSLLDDDALLPPLNPPAEIPDEDDVKPDDWVEDERIPDPAHAEKPADWDEKSPRHIPDPNAVQPEDWREDLEELIADPTAERPEDWDDEEDGEWVAPLVPNPECENLSGCGPYSAPLVINPDYKGPWVQPTIPNPDYKGIWKPRNIANPNYYQDERPTDLEPIGGIGLELWTMQADILFDNFYVGHSIEEAEIFGNATWSPKFYIENKEHQANAPGSHETKRDDAESLGDTLQELFDNPVEFLSRAYNDFLDDFHTSPVDAFRNHPATAAGFGFVFLIISSVVFGIFNVILTLVTGKQLPNIEQKERQNRGAAIAAADAAAVAETASDVRSNTTGTNAPAPELRRRKA